MRQPSLTERIQARAGLTNAVLCDEEVAIVRKLLLKAEKMLSQIKSSNSVQSRIVEKCSLQNITEDIARYRVAIAPHKKLPSELISYIFLLCLGHGSVTWPPKSNDPPWLFGHICSRWRRVSLDEPRLWTSFMVLGSNKDKTVGGLQPPAEEVIARSKGYPLSMVLDGPMGTTQILTPHSNKIHTLKIKDTNPPFLHSNLPFYSLESITLEFPSFDNDLWKMASYGKIPVLDNAPRLRKVALYYMDDHSIPLFSKSQFNINWAQLTSLTFFQISPPLPSALDIIREAVNLVEFHYIRPLGAFVGFGENSVNISPHIIHRNLQIVRLGLEASSDLGFFVERLTLPCLESFENSGSEVFEPSALLHPALLAFATRSSESLRVLSLSGKAQMPWMNEMFSAMPGLVELHLTDGYPISSSTFHLMRDGSLLPALEVLVCETLSVCALVKFLESRVNGLTFPSIRHAEIRGLEESLSIDDIIRGDEMFINIQPLFKEAGTRIYIVIHDGPMSYALGKRGEEGNGLFELFGS